MSLKVCVILVSLMACAGAATCGTPDDKGASGAGSEAKVFSFALQKGQYIFIGRETGAKGKGELDQGVDSIGRLHILPDTTSTWDLRVTVQPAAGENEEKVWKWEAVWRASDPDGTMHPRTSQTWQDTIPRDKKVEAVPIEKVDASKETGVDGLQFYKIPYAKVDDETHYLIIAIASNEDLFPKAISIPKKYFTWTWHGNWPSYK